MRTKHLAIVCASLLLCFSCGNESETNTVPDAGTTTSDTNTNDVSTSELGQGEPETVDEDSGEPDTVVENEPQSSEYFIYHTQPDKAPGRFPASACDEIKQHHTCVSTTACNWMRTIKNNGVCREDPITRCLATGECVCQAHDFHGSADYNDDLEFFVPLSVLWQNLAPRTSAYNGGEDHYTTSIEMEEIVNESLANFTSRTDFTYKTLTVHAKAPADVAGITQSEGLTLTLKFMPVWDKEPASMGGTLFQGLGLHATLKDNQLNIAVDGGSTSHSIAGENPMTGGIKDYQCNQFALVIPKSGDATAYLGATATALPGFTMATLQSQNNNHKSTAGSAVGHRQRQGLGPAALHPGTPTDRQ